MARIFLSQEKEMRSKFQVKKSFQEEGSQYNKWISISGHGKFIEFDSAGNEIRKGSNCDIQIDCPRDLGSLSGRLLKLARRVKKNDTISINYKREGKGRALAVISGKYEYFPSRIEIWKDKDTISSLVAILYTTESTEENERNEFYRLYKKGVSKRDLEALFLRDDIDREWNQARIRAGKEALKSTKNRINDYFQGIKGEYNNIIYGASYKNKYGETCCTYASNNTTKVETYENKEDETLFNQWEKFINIYSNNYENYYDVDYYIPLTQENIDDFKDFTFFITNYNRLNKEADNQVPIDVRIRVEEYEGGVPSAYSFFFHKRVGDDPIDLFQDHGLEFIRYIMHLKELVFLDASQAYDSLAIDNMKISIRSAISAIMSRNMSHNLGSHYLDYTQSDLFCLSEGIKEGEDIEEGDLYKNTKGAEKSFEFIRNRMYYIAAITDNLFDQQLPVHLMSEILPTITTSNDSEFTNFYLKNLVRSEEYSTDDINYGDITVTVDKDKSIQNLNEISIALPLGVVSSHAIYNILENFIRNSAKYQWGKRNIKKPKDINFTIRVLKGSTKGDLIFQFFDDKKQGNKRNGDEISLLKSLEDKLNNLRFLSDDGSLDKDDKGLKEMLLSAFWINSRHQGQSISEVVYDFETCNKKQDFLKEYGFTFILADDGKSLGIQFHLNQHFTCLSLKDRENYPYLTSDLVIVPKEAKRQRHYVREISNNPTEPEEYLWDMVEEKPTGVDYDNTLSLLQVEKRILGDIDSCILSFDETPEKSKDLKNPHFIIYSTHMSSEQSALAGYKQSYIKSKRVYFDSKSGENYTSILHNSFMASIQENMKYKTWKQKYLSLLIKEAALTRITIIDERFFNKIKFMRIESYGGGKIKGTSLELDTKNIQILGLRNDDCSYDNVYSLSNSTYFIGNEFRKVGMPSKSGEYSPHFISIHFSIIQKLLNSTGAGMSKYNVNSIITEILKDLGYYGDMASIHIIIHTGRGTLSKKETEAFTNYNIIPLESLSAAYNNCKFILCQLFYNLKY